MNALTTPNKTLFLSYSRKQTEWCDDLYNAIDTYTHFHRWRDSKIPESADWWDSICFNIEGCFAFIAILTDDYRKSVYCEGELDYALKLKKPVIALVLGDSEYPPELREKRVQFARVDGLDMPQVINKVLSACNQITLGYMQDDYSTDIHPRKHLRPPVPTPKQSTPTPEEDVILSEQVEQVAVHRDTQSSDNLMPQPFAWIDIPNKNYSIAKYPITNAQFAKFIDTGGYNNQDWWTEKGWTARQEGWHYDAGSWKPSGTPWTEPRYWQDKKWKGSEQPVVGVSWYEAVAFCLWLSDITGEHIMLPTEDQWQYAAQGDDGRKYPWGDDWDRELCNNNVDKKGVGKTTPVTQYEGKGDSPFGVVDMAGNVWEWCLTDYEDNSNDVNRDANRRVVRGGSWGASHANRFSCDCRGRHYPASRDDARGFRVSRS